MSCEVRPLVFSSEYCLGLEIQESVPLTEGEYTSFLFGNEIWRAILVEASEPRRSIRNPEPHVVADCCAQHDFL